ncbi:MAG TPA: hypothetical protein VF921_10865 [Vicinamibacterales bacterium]
MDDDRLALIQLVARRYRQLQGFRTVTDGVFLLLMPLVFRWDGHGFLNPGAMVSGTILFVAAASLAQHVVTARYDRRFGRAGGPSAGDRREPSVLAFYVAYALGVIAAQLTDTTWLRASVVLVALGAGPLWVCYRDWPHRAHWLLPVLAAIAGSAIFTGVRTVQEIAGWSVLVWRAGGLALIAAGLLDHALLVKAMTRDARETPQSVKP